MAISMLEYTKTILKKVSFDVKLFCREVEKAMSSLLPDEVEDLKNWLRNFIQDKPELRESLVYI